MLITPVILAGGSGERLWPLSKLDFPKQYVPLGLQQTMGAEPSSLFQDSIRRISDRTLFSAPIIVCNEEHRFIVTEQLRYLGVEDAIILIEPVARNTAPALALAAIHLEHEKSGGVLLVMPSDHTIGKPKAFLSAVAEGKKAAQKGYLLTFGITPNAPETGYGYIRQGTAIDGYKGIFRIERFVEKPNLETAKSYLLDGGYAWNSGMFMMDSGTLLAELSAHEPAIVDACRKSYGARHIDPPFIRMGKAEMEACPSNSIDYAIMEHTQKGAVIPADIDWCDLGSWTSLCNISQKDAQGNALSGKTVLADTQDCYIRSDEKLIATIGLRDMVIVSADNAVLVGAKDRMQDIKQLVKQMRERGLPDVTLTSFSHRPWGSFYSIDHGSHYQVKRLHLKPGGKISLQTHQKRSEHWIVVQGCATVTNGEHEFTLLANQSTYIPAGKVHRLENREDRELIVIEVQTGSYLGEDDIERFEDVYNRTPKA